MANIPAAEPLIQTLLAVVIDFQSNPFYHNWKLLVSINVYAEIRQYKTIYLLSHLIHSFAIISREKSTENRGDFTWNHDIIVFAKLAADRTCVEAAEFTRADLKHIEQNGRLECEGLR